MNKRVRIRLAKDWRALHKSFTVIISGLGILLGIVEVVMPHMGIIQPFLDPATYGIVMFVMTISIAVGRYLHQECIGKEVSRVNKDGSDPND